MAHSLSYSVWRLKWSTTVLRQPLYCPSRPLLAARCPIDGDLRRTNPFDPFLPVVGVRFAEFYSPMTLRPRIARTGFLHQCPYR
jgi:hypothetical protein